MSKQEKCTRPQEPPSNSFSVQVFDLVEVTDMRRVPYRSAPLWARCRWPQLGNNYHGEEKL